MYKFRKFDLVLIINYNKTYQTLKKQFYLSINKLKEWRRKITQDFKKGSNIQFKSHTLKQNGKSITDIDVAPGYYR